MKPPLNFPLTLVLILGITFAASHGDVNIKSDDEKFDEQTEEAISKWEENFKRIRKLSATLVKVAMPYFMNSATSGEFQISPACRHSLFQWIADLRALKPYALRMADASAKMVDGILTGTLSSYGSYDQCVDTVVPNKDVRGQYCFIESWPPLPPKPRFYAVNKRLPAFKRFENDTGLTGEVTKYLQLFYNFPFRVGICVPSTCSREDIFNVSQMVLKVVFPANVTVSRCETKEYLVLEYYQIPIMCVVGILVILVIYGTSVDMYLEKKKKDVSEQDKVEINYRIEFVKCFSIISNWKLLMDVEAGSDQLCVLHGIRFFSMLWIIFGHTYFHLNFNVLKYLQITIELTSQFIFNTITNASLLVDNFFFMSGLLGIYVSMDISKKTGKIPNAFYFIIHRIWRFLPIQMFFVGVSTVLPWMGDGPLWHENMDPVVDGCRRDWWANFLFINNLYRSSPKGCLSFSWYLAADFQVYIFTIPVVLLIMRKPKLGLSVNFMVMILSVLAVGIHNYIRDLPPTMLFTRADIEQRDALMAEVYYPPWPHLGPFCIGVFVGYYLRMKKTPKDIHWTLKAFAWILAFSCTTASLYGVHPWNAGIESMTGKLATVMYASLSRMSWTVGLAWITVACSTGCGGFLSSILRWKPFIPFSRLTFMVYMVHPLVQYVFYATLRDGIQARNCLALFIYFGFVVVSYAIAFVACLFVEAPFVNVGKVFFEIEEDLRKKKITIKSLLTGKTPREVVPERSVSNTNGWKPEQYLQNGKGVARIDVNTEWPPNMKTRIYRNFNHQGRDFICRL